MSKISVCKTDFEAALPVGTSSHENVFDMVRPSVDAAIEHYTHTLLGDAGLAMVEASGTLEAQFKRLAVLTGFLQVIRQLDVVLTPTGFGIVRNNNLSPASKMRVDDLESQLRTSEAKSLAEVVDGLRSPDWGETEMAAAAIPYLYDAHAFFFRRQEMGLTYRDWETLLAAVRAADEYLRIYISDAQMEELLTAYRTNDRNAMKAHANITRFIIRFTDEWAHTGVAAAGTLAFRNIIRELEGGIDSTFRTYAVSDAYKLIHHDTFRNEKNSSAYLFNG